jgi:hypothetical protein
MAGAGGLLSKIGKGLGAAAPALSGLAAGTQKGREAENVARQDEGLFKLREARNAEDALQERAGLDLKQREFAQGSRKENYDLARRAALGKNMKDVTVGGVPKGVTPIKFMGGSRPSAFGAEGRAASDEMYRQAMAGLMGGEKFDKMPAIERIGAPEFKGAGVMENILGAGAMAGSAINDYGAAKEQRSFQDRIAQAIEALSQGGTKPQVASAGGGIGVTPFVKPPTARLLDEDEGDLSNRG